jgi:protein phosphatase-4 regulatory subunit 3
VVIDEEDNQTLLVHRISADDIYRRQEDTIISWTDPEVATDLALSFQETMGCSFIWDQICSIQRSIHFPSVGGLESTARPLGDDLEHSGTSQDDDDAFHEGGGSEVINLPPAELAALPQIVKTIGEALPFNRERIATLIARDQTYIRKLMEIFRICEERGNTEGLRMMFKVVKGLISLNDGHIFDIIFSDEYLMDIVGALECKSKFSCLCINLGWYSLLSDVAILVCFWALDMASCHVCLILQKLCLAGVIINANLLADLSLILQMIQSCPLTNITVNI